MAKAVILKTIESNISTKVKIYAEPCHMGYIAFRICSKRRECNLKIMELMLPKRIIYDLIEWRNSFHLSLITQQIVGFMEKFLFYEADYLPIRRGIANNNKYVAINYYKFKRGLSAYEPDLTFYDVKCGYLWPTNYVDLPPERFTHHFTSDVQYKCCVYNEISQHCI